MKPNVKYLIILFVLSFSVLEVDAQIGGCDLCGPASGTSKNVASGNYSATIGVGCESKGLYSFAVGYLAKSYMTNTIAMGKFVKAQATNSIVIGSGSSNADSRMLTNGIPNSLMIGFNSCFPTLFVSSSNGFNTTGKVGIGNIVPKTKLHVKSDANEDAGFILEPSDMSNSAYIQLYNDKNIISVKPNVGLSVMSQNGNINFESDNIVMNAKVAINATENFLKDCDYALAVSGGILTTKVLVKEVDEWHDYVFDDDYALPSINYLQRYIGESGHLPDIPSESNVLANGYDMVEMDGLLLKKIEELTLYIIELNKLIECQQEIINTLQYK